MVIRIGSLIGMKLTSLITAMCVVKYQNEVSANDVKLKKWIIFTKIIYKHLLYHIMHVII